jgi:thioredoxin 1
MFGPVMEQISQVVPVEKINVDENSALAATYNVRSVPTTIILKDNREVSRFVGAKPKDLILESCNSL